MNDSVATVIFARGGSRGIPGKNLALIGGQSLLAHAITQGFDAGASEVYVSTDSEEIASEALEHGATVPFVRPSELAADRAPEWFAWQHFCSYIQRNHPGKYGHLLVLPTTSPLRTSGDVNGVLTTLLENQFDVVLSMSEAYRHPQFNLVSRSPSGEVKLYDPHGGHVSRRQDVSAVYDVTTVAYGAKIEFVRSASSMWEGSMGGWIVPRERALDIDTPFDLELAQFLWERRKADGRL
jgi:N-acylneuraminate cytidylyltransferase